MPDGGQRNGPHNGPRTSAAVLTGNGWRRRRVPEPKRRAETSAASRHWRLCADRMFAAVALDLNESRDRVPLVKSAV
jgi:hypothetical protein